uniref:Uncharacterized protein n=1 Tax=Heterorhabditis bacteriophora TaxID=37862 RepID=A0A1I7WHA1_HETBA
MALPSISLDDVFHEIHHQFE